VLPADKRRGEDIPAAADSRVEADNLRAVADSQVAADSRVEADNLRAVEDNLVAAGSRVAEDSRVEADNRAVADSRVEADNLRAVEDNLVVVDSRVAAGSRVAEDSRAAADIPAVVVDSRVAVASRRKSCRIWRKRCCPGLPGFRNWGRRSAAVCRTHCSISVRGRCWRRTWGILSIAAFHLSVTSITIYSGNVFPTHYV